MIDQRSKIERTLSKKALKMTDGRHKTNPFIADMIIPVKGRQVRLSSLGKDNNIIVNQDTGEILGGTHVTTYKKVDSEQFVKLFTANIGLTFDLSAQGIKAFGVLVWAIQNRSITKDEVYLDIHTREDFIEAHADDKRLKLSQPTFARGLAELTKAQIIAKTLRQGVYFINPNFIFNGDRIAFTTVIEKNNSDFMRV